MGILAREVLCLEKESAEWSPFCGRRAMADDDKRNKDRTSETARTKVKNTGERPFDLWLQKQLHAMYDEIASEPLPTDLLGLIETDAEKKDKPPGSSGKK
jgi:hypothetical protein